MFRGITKQEKIFLWGVIIFLILITALPYLYAYWNRPAGHEYLGLHGLTMGDIAGYYSRIEEVRQGNWLMSDLYAGPDTGTRYFNPFWQLIGTLASIFHLSNVFIFQLVRLILIPVFVFILYRLIMFFFAHEFQRKIALVFTIFSSGLGVYFINYFNVSTTLKGLYNWPMDLWVPEVNTFLTLYHTPHFVASLCLILGIFILMFLAFEQNKFKYSIWAGLLLALLIFFHPFHAPTIFMVLFVYVIVVMIKLRRIKWSFISHYLILFAISLPAILYYAWFLKNDWLTVQRSLQNVCLTPDLAVTLVSYGLLIPLSVLAILFLIQKKKIIENRYIFLVVWLVVQFYLIYSPVNFQRRLTEGLHIPLAILSFIGLIYLGVYLNKKLPKKYLDLWVNNKILWAVLFVLLFALSNLYAIARDIHIFQNKYAFLYLPTEKMQAIEWFKDNTGAEAVVLSHGYHGNLIPAWSGRFVYLGHDVETPMFSSRQDEVVWFFSSDSSDQGKRKFLSKNSITHIYYSDYEKALGEFMPEKKEYLEKVYSNSQVDIYKIVK